MNFAISKTNCKTLIIGLIFGFGFPVVSANAACFKQHPSDLTLPPSALQAESIKDLEVEYKKLYESEKRLNGRFYWSDEKRVYVADRPRGSVEIPDVFLQSLTSHIETALERGYADFLFYPDMGHAHLLLPKEERTEGSRPSDSEVLNSPDLKVLYHTGELLRMRSGSVHNGPVSSDPWLAWRYHTRNFIGRNDARQEVAVVFGGQGGGYNTVRSLEGHLEFSRIYFSAHKDGCFKAHVKGKTIFFDISLDNFTAPPAEFSFLRQ